MQSSFLVDYFALLQCINLKFMMSMWMRHFVINIVKPSDIVFVKSQSPILADAFNASLYEILFVVRIRGEFCIASISMCSIQKPNNMLFCINIWKSCAETFFGCKCVCVQQAHHADKVFIDNWFCLCYVLLDESIIVKSNIFKCARIFTKKKNRNKEKMFRRVDVHLI